ncbi:MAG TPA: hypothetical protein PLS93_00575, partial [Accumulibacter sp.]|nr:hypothetical protein [Accumulibacter sp.]
VQAICTRAIFLMVLLVIDLAVVAGARKGCGSLVGDGRRAAQIVGTRGQGGWRISTILSAPAFCHVDVASKVIARLRDRFWNGGTT